MFPESIAIAGAWGYIGQKFLEAARNLGLTTLVYDPGKAPPDVDLRGVARIPDECAFYREPADLFHLALHPEHRQLGLDILLRRARDEPVRILCEKPMAPPERPHACQEVVTAVGRSGARLLYDFPELFDPITRRILDFLSGFRAVQIESVYLKRSKDREDASNPRNYKRMVPVQYQESVHCLAFVLHLLSEVQGGLEPVFAEGLSIEARSQAYRPPNPQAYSHVVDGKCEYRLELGSISVEGTTDFTRGAEWAKRRIVCGTGDGRPFVIEADFLEEGKRLRIDGRSHDDLLTTNSYEEVIKTFGRWDRTLTHEQLMRGNYPHPSFAHVTYQLSSALWRSSRDGTSIALGSLEALMAFDAAFARAVPQLPRYLESESGPGA